MMEGFRDIRGKKALAAAMLVFFALSVTVIPAEAHMPGGEEPPEFEMDPVRIVDSGEVVKVTIDNVGEYHNERMMDFKAKKLRKQHPDWTDEEIRV